MDTKLMGGAEPSRSEAQPEVEEEGSGSPPPRGDATTDVPTNGSDLTQSPLGTCVMTWAGALERDKRQQAENPTKPWELFASDEWGRKLMVAAFAPTSSARTFGWHLCVLLCDYAGLCAIMRVAGFAALSCASCGFLGLNVACKLTAARLEVFADGFSTANVNNATCLVCRLAPEAATQKRWRLIEKNAQLNPSTPSSKLKLVLGTLALYGPVVGQLVSSWQALEVWERGALAFVIARFTTDFLGHLFGCTRATGPDFAAAPQAMYMTFVLFIPTAYALACTIDELGIWEREASATDRLEKLSFKEAFRNFELMANVVDQFSDSWKFYFFFAEFMLVMIALSAALGTWMEIAALRSNPDCGCGARIGVMASLTLLAVFVIVVVYTSAAGISRACRAVLKRTRKLNASIEMHDCDEEVRAQWKRFHDHVARRNLGFRAMGVTITNKLAATMLYPLVTLTCTLIFRSHMSDSFDLTA